MEFSIMTTSFPIDQLTLQELKQLAEECSAIDFVHYEGVMNLPLATDYMAKGFLVLVYDEHADSLVAAASSIDLVGLNTFEWSMLVHPMYRKIGLGSTLYKTLQKELNNRSAAGQLALLMESEGYGKTFIEQQQFGYSFSEATLEANAKQHTPTSDIHVIPFEQQHTEQLVQVLCQAFGDDEQEALELIHYNSTQEHLQLWVAMLDEKVVGTVTTRKDLDAYWITALAVHEVEQRKGIGSALIYAVQNLAFEENIPYVKLDVELDNDKALNIYKKTGFIKVAQIDYYAKL